MAGADARAHLERGRPPFVRSVTSVFKNRLQLTAIRDKITRRLSSSARTWNKAAWLAPAIGKRRPFGASNRSLKTPVTRWWRSMSVCGACAVRVGRFPTTRPSICAHLASAGQHGWCCRRGFNRATPGCCDGVCGAASHAPCRASSSFVRQTSPKKRSRARCQKRSWCPSRGCATPRS